MTLPPFPTSVTAHLAMYLEMDVIAEATVAYPFIFVLSILRGIELVFGKFLLSGIGLQCVVIENVHATIILLNLYI